MKVGFARVYIFCGIRLLSKPGNNDSAYQETNKIQEAGTRETLN